MLLRAVVAFTISGITLFLYFRHLKSELKDKRKVDEKPASYGKPIVGGPFTLMDCNGNTVSDTDFRGKFMLVYFGYTFCPDVCPEELERMGEIIDIVDSTPELPKDSLVPLFISCDPKRDTLEVLKNYLKGKILFFFFFPPSLFLSISLVFEDYRI